MSRHRHPAPPSGRDPRPDTRHRPTRRAVAAALATAAGSLAAPAILRAQTRPSVRIMQLHGLMYIPIEMMVHGTGGVGNLKQTAAAAGLGDVDVTLTAVNGGAPIIDGLLSGTTDYGTVALTSLITLWEKSRGTPNETRVVGTVSNAPMTLYTINPKVQSLADLGETDRIAVPTVKTSANAIMLQMAAEKLWGDASRLDPLTVQMGHPDAVAQLTGGFGKSSITGHVAIEPFTSRGLKIAGAHALLDSHTVFGGFMTQVVLISTKRVHDANPALFKAVGAALETSIKAVNADKAAACALYKERQKAAEPVEDLVAQVTDPRFAFTSQPQRVMHLVDFFKRNGRLKAPIERWQDVFWETAHHQQGT